jgi:hypothetical protein
LEPVELSFSKQKLKLASGSVGNCPKAMSFSASYPMPIITGFGPLFGRLD